jgi:hypothetical protein
VVCDNTIRATCDAHGGAMGRWQCDDPAAARAFRAAGGDVEFQTDGTSVNTTGGWREMRLSLFAKRGRGAPAGPEGWQQRDLPPPRVRVVRAAIRSGQELGPDWWRMADRLGVDPGEITVLADGARWIWAQVAEHLPGAAGVLDIYHASEHLWEAANREFGEGTEGARARVEEQRGVLLSSGVEGLLAGLPEGTGEVLRSYFAPHVGHTDYAGRLARGQSIGSGLVEGSCKQVIGRRLKQTGARWAVRRAERVATLCAVQASGQWDAYWRAAA